MNKLFLILMSIFVLGCDATPQILNKNNSKGHIVVDKNLAVEQVITAAPEIPWGIIIWIICIVLFSIALFNFINIFKNNKSNSKSVTKRK